MGVDPRSKDESKPEPQAVPFDQDAGPPRDFTVGHVVFEKYRLIEKIAEGDIGEVWRVWHLDLETERALKVIGPEFAGNEEGWKRFEREVRLMIKIGHPNIAVIYDLKRTDSFGYIEMEFVRGQSLDKILKESPDQPQALEWIAEVVAQLCWALQAAHDVGIVHRDIKPSHLMIVNAGTPSEPLKLKVLDFSIARLLEREPAAGLTSSGRLLGTPAYMSPERVSGGMGPDGQSQELDWRSDIYSAGVVVYQLLSGKPPFRGSIIDVIAAHLHAPPPSMAVANPGVKTPPEVERLVMQCLEKDPDRRPRSARDLAALFRESTVEPLSSPAESTAAGSPSEPPKPETSLRAIETMPRTISCQKCGIVLNLPARIAAGKRLKCPACGGRFEVSEKDANTASTAPGDADADLASSRDFGRRPPSADELEVSLADGDLCDFFELPKGTAAEIEKSAVSERKPTISDAEALFQEELARKKKLSAAEARARARRCMICGGVVAAGTSICPSCGVDQEMGMRIGLEEDQAPLAPPRLSLSRSLVRMALSALALPVVGIACAIGWLLERLQRSLQPDTIRRHTDVSFPAVVQAGKVYNLRVQLVPAEEVLPSGEVRERPRPHAHDATLDLLVTPPPTPDTVPPPVKLTISVAAENFEVEGSSRTDIVVPLAGKSPAAQFGLQGLQAGPGRIMVDFAQAGRPVGSVDLMPEVVADLAACRRPDRLAAPSNKLSLTLDLGGAPAPPDVVLKVFEHRTAGHPGRLQFVLSSRHAALADWPVLDGDLGTLDLRTDVAGWVGDQLRAIGALVEQGEPQTDDVSRTLAAVGFNLFQHLLPPAVQELSWSLRQRGIKTLLILSDDPHIPWELIKPFRADPHTGAILSEDDFWGESYALAHWLRGRPPASRFSITRVLGVATTSGGNLQESTQRIESSAASAGSAASRDMKQLGTASARTDPSLDPAGSGRDELQPAAPIEPSVPGLGIAALGSVTGLKGAGGSGKPLDAADEELALLRSLEALGARVERLPALRGAFRRAFEEGSFDLLHLVSHGSFGGTAHGDASAVFLDDGLFTAAELSPLMAGALRRTAPLVIFNTCHCGRMGFSLTRLGSWGAHLAQLGCGGFIGALWPVSDRAALAFARALYEQLAQNCALGEAVRLARLCVRERYPGDPTWLAYSCFADPTARIERAKAARY
jgi:serine/threonine-protein kinase